MWLVPSLADREGKGVAMEWLAEEGHQLLRLPLLLLLMLMLMLMHHWTAQGEAEGAV